MRCFTLQRWCLRARWYRTLLCPGHCPREVSVLLSLLLMLSTLPAPVLAAETEPTAPTEPESPAGSTPSLVHGIDAAVAAVQEQINAFPTAEELAAMGREEQQTAYGQVQAAYDAYRALTDEQRGQITGGEIFDRLFEVFNSMVNAPADTGAFSVTGGTEKSKGYTELTFALATNVVKYSGEYTGRVTFTVRLAEEQSGGNEETASY